MVLTDPLEKKSIDNLITNGIRIKGHLVAQDETCIFLKKGNMQTIYKHRIEIITPEHHFIRL